MTVTTARHKVLTYLQKTRSASAREIARALKMFAPNVRHHLGILVSDGRVEALTARPREGRGRPEKIYSLSRAALGDNLAALANALLAESALPKEHRDNVSRVEALGMEAVGRRLAGDANLSAYPVAKRLSLVIEKLNAMNYYARWEAGADGPRLIFGLCPYAAVIEKHPQLCKMDAAMLETLLALGVEQRAKIGKDGDQGCVFAVGK